MLHSKSAEIQYRFSVACRNLFISIITREEVGILCKCKLEKYRGRNYYIKILVLVSIKTKTAFILIKPTAPESRITNAEATVVQKLNRIQVPFLGQAKK